MNAPGPGSNRELSRRCLLLATITAAAGLFITVNTTLAGDNPACSAKS